MPMAYASNRVLMSARSSPSTSMRVVVPAGSWALSTASIRPIHGSRVSWYSSSIRISFVE